ncbi:MAG: hypothetical protein RLZ98_558 [Pseudomonadota bacterium]
MKQIDLRGKCFKHGNPSRLPVLAAAAAVALMVAGCSTEITKHGNLLSLSDIQRVQTGMNSDEVRMSLGTPATTATVGEGQAYYYVQSTMHETTLGGTKEVDRRVTAVYFSPTGGVERVASYGLKDGKVFDFISRTTPSAGSGDKGIINDLFRNLGQRTFNMGGE